MAHETMLSSEELDVDIVPGTEIMTDVGGHHFVKSKSSSNLVLVPQPDNNPHDPLNWAPFWKTSAMVCATLNFFAQGFGPLALARVFLQMTETFNCTLPQAIQFTSVTILILGLSNMIWVPFVITFGRRGVYITSALILMCSSIWKAKATTYGSFIGACALNGISAVRGETIQPAVLADVFFLHDRGKQNTLYFAFYFAALMVGPIVYGVIGDHVGWQSFWWLKAALLALTAILTIFVFPETKWDRVGPQRQLVAMEQRKEPHATNFLEKRHDRNDVPQSNVGSKRMELTGAWDQKTRILVEHIEWNERYTLIVSCVGKPSRSRFNLFQASEHAAKWPLISFWIPWKLLAFPIVEFASFAVSRTASFFLLTNITQSEAFAAPPYNYSPQTIGLFNLATLVGAGIGLLTAGPLSDWIPMRATRKNKEIHEPEMRLPTIIPFLMVNILQLYRCFRVPELLALGSIVIIGYGCASIQDTALPAIDSAYAIDSYKPAAGSLFVSITINKNIWGCGFSRFLAPWIIKPGYVKPIICNMGLTVLMCSFGLLFYFKGKTFSRWTRNSNVHNCDWIVEAVSQTIWQAPVGSMFYTF